MTITLYNVISYDGFVASKDRNEDFIPDELWNEFISACNQNDVLVWGKNTYEKFKEYDQKLIAEFLALPIKKIILTKDSAYISEKPFLTVHSVEDIPMLGANVLVSGSAILNNLFLERQMVNRVITNILPIILSEGIPRFTIQPNLILDSEKSKSEWIERKYTVNYRG